jgi:hypothetical protein
MTPVHHLILRRRPRRGIAARTAASALAAATAFLLLSAAPLAHASAGATGAGSLRGSAATTASGPLEITGTFTWHETQDLAQGTSLTGTETQSGTFSIDVTTPNPPTYSGQPWDDVNSSYQVSDTYNATEGASTSCPAYYQASSSASGDFPPGPFGVAYWGPPKDHVVTFHMDAALTEQVTATSPCASTVTFPRSLLVIPQCFNTADGGSDVVGTFTGANDIGTITINCSGTSGAYTYSASGTLTVKPAASDLQITSPPDTAVIAVTDPAYLTPQPGPAERAPTHRHLKVSGTATCPGPVTISGVSAPVSGGVWHAEIPVSKVGPMTLTATAKDCRQAVATVTLISLDITSPAENARLPITAAPAMPALDATARVTGYPGDTSGTPFDWTLKALGLQVTRAGTPGHWTPNWAGYEQTAATGSTTGTGEAWQPSYSHIIGGIGRLTVSASLPGVLDNPVTSDPRWIGLPGTNPPAPTAKAFVNQADPQYADTIRHIVCAESRWYQFNADSFHPENNGQPKIPGVPADWSPNPGIKQPLFGPPAGIGISQLDPAKLTSPDEYWNWQVNLRDGITLFHAKLALARQLVTAEQKRLADRLQRALNKVKLPRQNKNLPPLQMTVITVPPLTDQQVLLQTIRLYNGGNEFHFNADYVVTSDNLNVKLIGTSAWVEDPAGSWAPHPRT